MVYRIEDLLNVLPEQKVLYSVSPPAAKEFGILPVEVRKLEGSAADILDVVGLEGKDEIDSAIGWQTFKKIVNYRGKVNQETWNGAYQRFYSDLL